MYSDAGEDEDEAVHVQERMVPDLSNPDRAVVGAVNVLGQLEPPLPVRMPARLANEDEGNNIIVHASKQTNKNRRTMSSNSSTHHLLICCSNGNMVSL